MLVVFLGYKILILVFLGSSGKFRAEMNFWYFLGSAHFPYRAKLKSFLNIFSKLDKIVRQTLIRLFKLTDFFPGFYRVFVLQTVGHLPGIFTLNPVFNFCLFLRR